MTIYAVEAKHNKTKNSRISSEAYKDLFEAVKFVESRADNPKRQDDRFIWAGSQYTYTIQFLDLR